jgi:hypothetical protein
MLGWKQVLHIFIQTSYQQAWKISLKKSKRNPKKEPYWRLRIKCSF